MTEEELMLFEDEFDKTYKGSRLESYKLTVNPSVWRKLHKLYLANKHKINCPICPYHKIENATRKSSHRSWKRYRKTQYKQNESSILSTYTKFEGS